MRSMLESWISDESFSLSSSAVETSKSTGSDVESECVWTAVPVPQPNIKDDVELAASGETRSAG